MDTQNLVKMANQIGDFFESYPDEEEALREIALHLSKFWAPRMRRQLLEHIERGRGEGLKRIVVTSAQVHRDKL